jgi:hypothetical protein
MGLTAILVNELHENVIIECMVGLPTIVIHENGHAHLLPENKIPFFVLQEDHVELNNQIQLDVIYET